MDLGKVETLGDVQKVLNGMKDQGITLGSVLYVLERVYYKEIEEGKENQRLLREMLAAVL